METMSGSGFWFGLLCEFECEPRSSGDNPDISPVLVPIPGWGSLTGGVEVDDVLGGEVAAAPGRSAAGQQQEQQQGQPRRPGHGPASTCSCGGRESPPGQSHKIRVSQAGKPLRASSAGVSVDFSVSGGFNSALAFLSTPVWICIPTGW